MGIFEFIIVFMFSIGILLGGFGLLDWIIIYPICKYKLRRKSNKLQWKFKKISKKTNNNTHYGFLYYRILPSKISTFVKIFGDNYWKYHIDTELSEEEFVEFAHKYDTLGKLKTEDYWIEP